MTVPVESILRAAIAQAGKPYIFGVEVRLSDPNPRAFDCSELVEWACAQAGLQPMMPDGTWAQHGFCVSHSTMIPVDAGIDTRGALLFNHRDAAGRPVDDPATRPPTAHVALSLGDGTTIEAMGTDWGTRIGGAYKRNWTHAARIPGADYSPFVPPQPPPPKPPTGPRGKPWMQVGSSGDDVRELQRMLVDYGVDRLPTHAATGQFTDLTDIAIRLVQEHVRANFDPTMDVDGKCGPVTWGWIAKLTETAPQANAPWLERGAGPGPGIAALQQRLIATGVRRLATLQPTGNFGPLTDLAVRLFQWHVKMTFVPTMEVDGICGPVTWGYLKSQAPHAGP